MAADSGSAYWVHRIVRFAEAEGGALRHPIVLMHNQPAGNPATGGPAGDHPVVPLTRLPLRHLLAHGGRHVRGAGSARQVHPCWASGR